MGLSLIFIDKLIIIGNKQSLFLLHMIGSLLHVFLMNRLFAASGSNLYDIAPGAVWRSVRHLSRLFFFVWSRLIGRRSFNARALLLMIEKNFADQDLLALRDDWLLDLMTI